jgi:hypothetical protein
VTKHDSKKSFEPKVENFQATNGQLLTNKDQVLSRWKEYFEKHLNDSSEKEQRTDTLSLIDWKKICRLLPYAN